MAEESLISKAANSDILSGVARLFSIVTPMLFVPLLAWLFSTVTETANTVAVQSVKIELIDKRTTGIETTMKESDRIREQLENERRKDWIDIRERMTRVEVQNAAILDALRRLADQMDSRSPRR